MTEAGNLEVYRGQVRQYECPLCGALKGEFCKRSVPCNEAHSHMDMACVTVPGKPAHETPTFYVHDDRSMVHAQALRDAKPACDHCWETVPSAVPAMTAPEGGWPAVQKCKHCHDRRRRMVKVEYEKIDRHGLREFYGI